jgi:hypothetical protein
MGNKSNASGRKVPVTTRALVQRINRKLAAEDMKLKATRGMRAVADLGDFYVIDASRNFVVDKDVNIEELGRKVGALQPWEVLADT